MHAHICIWLDPDDVDTLKEEITAHKPGTTDTSGRNVEPPHEHSHARRLHDIIIQKMLHKCRKGLCHIDKHCKLGFPMKQQTQRAACMNENTQKYDYYRPRFTDRNVVPYHPLLTYFWGAHANVLLVTGTNLSTYLMKYQMKASDTGTLDIDIDAAKSMGIDDLTDEQLKAASAMFITRPVSSTEAAMHVLGYAMIERSPNMTVRSINTAPPKRRMMTFKHKAASTSSSVINLAPVDRYTARPEALESVTFSEYFKWYDLEKQEMKRPGNKTLRGQDNHGCFVYERPTKRLVRYTEYHPVHNMEGYFYNYLLSTVPFRCESQLISEHRSYFDAVVAMGDSIAPGDIRTDDTERDDDMMTLSRRVLEKHIIDYASKKLLATFDTDALLDMAFNQLQDDDDNRNNPDSSSWFIAHPFNDPRLPVDEQIPALHALTKPDACGYHLLEGGPGAGKTLLVRHIIDAHIAAGRKVLVAASTGAAALRISSKARTCHNLFNINPAHRFLTPLMQHHDAYSALQSADVIIIDEFSMLTSQILNIIDHRLKVIHHANVQTDSTHHMPLVILVGDPRQLPPVCKCRKAGDTACRSCSFTSSKVYSNITRHSLHS